MAESLEQKAKTGSRWYHYIGGFALTAALVGGAVCIHKNSSDAGYKAGKKAQCIEERGAGIEEGKRIAHKESSSFGWFDRYEIYASFTKEIENLGRVTYSLSLNGLPGTGEVVRVEQHDRSAVSYADGGWGFNRDGLVDMIIFTDTEGYPSFLFREQHYAGNERLFEDANETLKQMKDFFRQRY